MNEKEKERIEFEKEKKGMTAKVLFWGSLGLGMLFAYTTGFNYGFRIGELNGETKIVKGILSHDINIQQF